MNAEDITVGMLVSYVDKNGETVTGEVAKGPVQMKHATVVFIKGKRGFVSIKNLTVPA